MLRLLGLLVIVGAIAFSTNPTAATMDAAADAKLKAITEAAADNVDIGGALGGVIAQAVEGQYESFYVASRYAKPAGDTPLVECWGAFTQVMCNKVGSPQ